MPVLRDETGRLIGRVFQDAGGVLIARDSTGKNVGEYDPSTDTTRDRTGRVVGRGNLLASLVKPKGSASA